MIKLQVEAGALKGAEQEWRQRARRVDSVLTNAIQGFGKEAAEYLQEQIRGNALGLAKKKSGIPLIRSGVYVASIRSEGKGHAVEIKPTGQNLRMSNEALGELLEYGGLGVQPKPHWRVLKLWMERNAAKKIGKKVSDELLGNS